MTPITPAGAIPRTAPAAPQADPLRKAATDFEAVFLQEMFKHAGLGAARGDYGGGVGEEAFAGLLAREWAQKVAEAGGLGLSDRIHQALAARAGDDA